ncbi:MAG: DMT family transporter [Candidatus Thermoplasmatota archaeon]
MLRKKWINYILLTLASLAFAASFIAVRLTVDEIPPVYLGFLRFAVATPIMILILFFSKSKKITLSVFKKNIFSISLLGLTGVTFLYIFQFTGIKLTNASTGGVLINTNVIFISIFSAIFLKEIFSLKKISGIIISFLGVIVVILGQMGNQQIVFDISFLIGCIFVILSAVCWAIFSVLGKYLLSRFDTFVITTYAFIMGTIFFIPFVFSDIIDLLFSISLTGWLGVLYLGLICSIFAYLAWYHVLSKREVGSSAVFLNLIPLFTIVLSSFIGESIGLLFLFGGFLIMIGVYLAQD